MPPTAAALRTAVLEHWAGAGPAPSRRGFLAARAAGRRAQYYGALDMHAALSGEAQREAERYILSVFGAHPYHFLARGERVLSLNHLLRRPRNFFFTEEHAAVYAAPSYSEFGPGDFTDDRGNSYRVEPRYPANVLLVKLQRTTKRNRPDGHSANPWGLPAVGQALELRPAGGGASLTVTVVASVFDTQNSVVPRKTGYVKLQEALPREALPRDADQSYA
jgi:hypothetical protein